MSNKRIASDPMMLVQTAVLESDAGTLRQVLKDHPEIKSRLNEPLPDYGFGATALIAAVQRTAKEVIDILLQNGADINGRSDWWAGSFGVLDDDRGLADFLIERGAIVDVHAAARLGMMDKLKELIAADPERVHARGGDGQLPLHFAATVEIADFLLDNGARIDAVDIDHESTAAQYLVRDRQNVVRRLVERGCRTDVLMAAALGDIELVRQHLEKDPDCVRMTVSEEYFPERNPKAGGCIYIWKLGKNKTPHLVAREFGHEEVFRLLMDNSPPEVKLAQACELGDEATFKALLASRPNGVASLTDAEQRRLPNAAQNNNTGAVRLMLEAGWPVGARGELGGTALHWACYHGNSAMVEVILRHQPPLELADLTYDGKPMGWALHGSGDSWHRATGNYPATLEALIRAGAEVPEVLQCSEEARVMLEGARERVAEAAHFNRQ